MKGFKLFLLVFFAALNVYAEGGKIEINPGTPLSPTDRLISQLDDGQVEEAFKAAADRMLQHYTDDPNSCLGRKQVGTCKLAKQLQVLGGYYFCRDLDTYNGILEETIPMYSYYVPFQMTETSQTPYDTGYMTAEIVKNLKAKAEEFLHAGMMLEAGGSTPAKREIDMLKKVGDKFGFKPGGKDESGNEVDKTEELKTKLQEEIDRMEEDNPGVIRAIKDLKELELELEGKKISMEDATFRAASSKNGRFMEMHVYPTGFDTNEKNRDEYFEDIWTHQGAKNSWIDKKHPVPIWFSEFPESVLTMRFNQYARNSAAANLLKAETEMDSCLTQKREAGSLDTIFEGTLRPLVGTDDKCAPKEIAFYGPLFSVPFNFDKETLYSPQAATKRDFMAIKLAFILGKNLGVMNPDQSQPIGNFHDLQFADDGEHKRDRMQFLDLHREPANPVNRSRNVNIKSGGDTGCMAQEMYYLPNIRGDEYGDANVDTEGERFTTAHYRFIQACPVCYLPVSNETILY